MTVLLPVRDTRGLDQPSLETILTQQQRCKADLVVPTHSLRSERGLFVVARQPVHLGQDGVLDPNGSFVATSTAEAGLCRALGKVLTPRYLRECRAAGNLRAFDNGINDWARHQMAASGKQDPTNVLIRLMVGQPGQSSHESGILRAVTSDRYGILDNLDMATAFLQGVSTAGVGSTVLAADITDDHLYIDLDAPAVAVAAPRLLQGYRSPFTGELAQDCPLVSAGIAFRNSETAQSRAEIQFKIKVRICGNGMTLPATKVFAVHRGHELPAGMLGYSPETTRSIVETFSLKIRDTVATFLTKSFLQDCVTDLEEVGEVRLRDPAPQFETIAKKLVYTQEERAGIWRHYELGGAAPIAASVMHAVTAYAQTVPSIGRAHELESSAFAAMEHAALLNK